MLCSNWSESFPWTRGGLGVRLIHRFQSETGAPEFPRRGPLVIEFVTAALEQSRNREVAV